MAVTQSHYRFGIDQLAESTHGWYAAEDTNPVGGAIPVNTTFLLRFTLQCDATLQSNIDPEFQYRKNGGTWTQITTSTSNVKAVTPGCWSDGANTTQRLSGTGTFEASSAGCTVDGIAGGTAFDIIASGNGETECALQLVGADLVTGDFIEFRLTRDGAVLIDTYAVTPGISLATDLSASVSESRRLFDIAAGFAIGAAMLSSGLSREILKAADAVQAQLIPPSNLSVQVANESSRVCDRVYGAVRFVASAADRAAGLEEAPIKASTSGQVALIEYADRVRLADGPPVVALVGDELSATPAEAVKVADGPPTGHVPLTASLAESLKVVDGPARRILSSLTIGNNTTDTVTGTEDTELNSFEPTTNKGTVVNLEATKFDASTHTNSLIRFTGLSAIDPTAVVVNAVLSLYLDDAVGAGAQTISAQRCLRAWTENGATWNKYDGTTDWQVAGATGALDRSATISATATGVTATLGYYNFTGGQLIADVQAFINGSLVNNGWVTERTDGADDLSYRMFVSHEAANGKRPILTLTFGAAVEALVAEAAKIADTVTTQLDPEQAQPSDSVKVADGVPIGRLDPILGFLQESVTVADALSGSLVGDLLAALQESVTVGTSGQVQLIEPLERLRIADSASAAIGSPTDLSAAPAEALKVADSVITALDRSVSVSESLSVVDSGLVELSRDETLTVADAVTVAINLAAVLAEALKVVDAVSASYDIAQASLSDSLKVVDSVLGPTLDPEQAAITEGVTVADAVSTTLDPEQAALVDSVKVADAAAVAMQWAVALATDAVKVADTPSLTLDPEQALASESLSVVDTLSVLIGSNLAGTAQEALKVADAVSTSLDQEQASPADALKVVDSLTVSVSLSVLVGDESVRVADVVSPTLDPEQATGADAVRVVDTVVVAIGTDFTATIQDSLKVVDTVTVRIDPEQLSAIEALSVVDAVTVRLDLAVVVQDEACRVADGPLGTLDPLQAFTAESVHVTDQASGGVDIQQAQLSDDVLTLGDSLTVTRTQQEPGEYFVVGAENRYVVVEAQGRYFIVEPRG